MNGTQPAPDHHRARYYIVLTTLVIAGIFVLLLLNDKNGFNLTGSSIKVFENKSGAPVEGNLLLDERIDPLSKETALSSKEVGVALTFNKIPVVRKQARIKDLELRFDDLTTTINVNNDKLELSNLQQVALKIKDFDGKVDLNSLGFSLDGTAKRLELNGMALASQAKIKIAFNNLDYRYLQVDDIQLKDLELQSGDGTLQVAQKLTYVLEQEDVKFYYFDGKMVVDKENVTGVNLEGVARGVGISGALLNLNVK